MGKLVIGFIVLNIISLGAIAASDAGVGQVAQHMLVNPVAYAFTFIDTLCLVIGFSFLFASVIKYIEHKRSPLMVPMSTVVFLIIAGIVLIILPLIAVLTDNGIRYRF
jgi:hypothetical protein